MTGENVTSLTLKNEEDRSSNCINRYQLFESIVERKYCHRRRNVIHLILSDFIQNYSQFRDFLPKKKWNFYVKAMREHSQIDMPME